MSVPVVPPGLVFAVGVGDAEPGTAGADIWAGSDGGAIKFADFIFARAFNPASVAKTASAPNSSHTMGEVRFDFGTAGSKVAGTTTVASVERDVRKLAAALGANAAVGYPVPVGERSAV